MAIGVFFLLTMLIVQIGFLVLARNVAAVSVDAALRRAVISDLDASSVRASIERDVLAVVPGATGVSVAIRGDAASVRALLKFRWLPPGPDFVPLTVSIERSAARVIPP